MSNLPIRARGAGLRLFILVGVLRAMSPVAALQHEQHTPPAKSNRSAAPGAQLPENLGWEPIRCWRQASAGAIAIGETFTVVLTCAVYEGDNAQVVPDESRLGVASIQMAPFEILGGSHPPDVRRGTRRFFQYDYQLRIIGPDAVGADINVPPLTISYRIHSRVGAAATLEGRDLSYLLPMMPIKVLSMVPADASDIRDASEASLAAVDSLRFRSSLFRVLAITFGALAAAMAVLALVPLARKQAGAADADRGRIPDRAILAEATRGLIALQSEAARGGWQDDTIARAAGLTRIVAAAAIGHPISQKPLPAGGATPEGRLRVSHGSIRSTNVSVSSAVTADDLQRARTSGAASSATTRQQQLAGLQEGLMAMTAAQYAKVPARDAAALDEAVRQAIAVGRDIAAERSWISEWARR